MKIGTENEKLATHNEGYLREYNTRLYLSLLAVSYILPWGHRVYNAHRTLRHYHLSRVTCTSKKYKLLQRTSLYCCNWKKWKIQEK